MELIKNPEALQAALSKPGLDQQTFYLDPVTSNDGYSRSLILLGIFLLFPASLIAFNFFPDDTWPLICLGLLVGGCFYALHSFNEFWEVDLVARELRLRESFLGFLRTRKTIPFGRLLSLAVSGHQHCSNKSNRIRRWWEYGIAVLEADGTSHRLFPNLSRSYKTVRDLAELLAETLEVSFFTPRPLGELEVVEEDGQQRYRYATSAEALLKVDSTPAEVPEESTEPAWKESPGQAEALEFVEEQEAAGQAGCAILGLVVVSPFALTGVRWLCQGVLDGDPGRIFLGLVGGLPALALCWWAVRWLMNPIAKHVRTVESGRVSFDQVRAKGTQRILDVAIPSSAQVKIRETSVDAKVSWRLHIVDAKGTSLFDFAPPKSRQEALDKARLIARKLGISQELDSDFE